MAIVISMASCDDNSGSPYDEEHGDQTLTGTWVLFERGYSPGFGYIVEEVKDGQTLTLRSNGTLRTNLTDIRDFKFYYVHNAVNPVETVIAFFEEDPGPSPDPSTFRTSYNVTFDGNTVRLGYRYCFEGCHLGFRRVE